MIHVLLGFALVLHGVEHRGHVQRTASSDSHHPLDFAEIYVKSCEITDGDRPWLPVYADSKLTTPLPNPIATDIYGAFHYYTLSPYAVTIYQDAYGKSMVFENCPTK